ncbi:hypothetical protein [Enterococcus sp. DIV2163]|uniref:hypothetical protein n=1 Tax=Enterococcus sp. DIV2163 TaxID=2774834 RepID=UPI003D2FBCC9
MEIIKGHFVEYHDIKSENDIDLCLRPDEFINRTIDLKQAKAQRQDAAILT